jgi:hypothetical protein
VLRSGRREELWLNGWICLDAAAEAVAALDLNQGPVSNERECNLQVRQWAAHGEMVVAMYKNADYRDLMLKARIGNRVYLSPPGCSMRVVARGNGRRYIDTAVVVQTVDRHSQ